MNTRLKGLTAALACAAALGAAGTADAKQDNHGSVRRCEAAANGQHNGFACETAAGDTVRGRCPSGYEAVPTPYDARYDLNDNGIICRSASGDYTDDLSNR